MAVWGKNEVIVPPETQARVADRQIVLEYDWLWGSGGDTRPLIIRLPEATITLSSGRFAITYFPDRAAWRYVMQGNAVARATSRDDATTVREGEMLVLARGARWKAVPLDPVVIAALGANDMSPVTPVWEQSLNARLRDTFGQMGITLAQMTTFVTYLFVVAALVFAPLWAIIMVTRQRRRLK